MRLPPKEHDRRVLYLAAIEVYRDQYGIRYWRDAYKELERKHPSASPWGTLLAAAQFLKRNRTAVYLKSVEIQQDLTDDQPRTSIYGDSHEYTGGVHEERDSTDAERINEERRDFCLRSVAEIKAQILVDAALRERVVWYYVMHALRGGK